MLSEDQVIWQPYRGNGVDMLPEICTSDQNIWCIVSPMICFEIVERHNADRVLRQFGMEQGIPILRPSNLRLEALLRTGRSTEEWRSYHASYIRQWDECMHNIVGGAPLIHPWQFRVQYMKWYRSITIYTYVASVEFSD